jgi:CheY-like chemotaxis protein
MQVDGLQHQPLPDTISKDVEKLQQVVHDALSYNQNLMTELKPPPVLDKENVAEVVHWTAKKMKERGLTIIIEDDGKRKPVESEIRIVFYQSVRELLQNIIKHADTNEARISISHENDQAMVIVEDKGKGFDINKERMTPTEEGGFGLFNIQERVNWHGGSFEIFSETGKGTKAILYAPLKNKKKQDISHQDKQSHLIPDEKQVKLRQNLNILLVDDHDMVRKGLRQMIEQQDDMSVVAEASDGREAVELARRYSPDIIVMDVNMPVMDGIEATQKIKSEMPNIRIIGLSLHDSEEVIQNMYNAGASSYLIKNEAFETLIKTIRSEVAA